MRNLIIATISLIGIWILPLIIIIYFDYSLPGNLVIVLISLSLISIGEIGLELYNLRRKRPQNKLNE